MLVKAPGLDGSSFNTRIPDQVYYVHPSWVSRHNIIGMRACVHLIPSRFPMRLTRDYRICTPMSAGDDDDYFLCVHTSADISVYSPGTADLSDLRWFDHSIPQSSLPLTPLPLAFPFRDSNFSHDH